MAKQRHNLQEINKFQENLADFEHLHYPLPGIGAALDRLVFIKQLIDSVRRVNYVRSIESRPISIQRTDPNSDVFDPIRAALLHKNSGNFDEACWLVFLATHFGVHIKSKWRYVQEVYGKLGAQPYWSWNEASINLTDFRNWLRANEAHISRGTDRGFGGHRPYTSLSADKPSGTGAAVESYVGWIRKHGNHQGLITNALNACSGNNKRAFDYLYRSMAEVRSFGRLARFDYLTMLAKTGLAPITPPHTYLQGATGPVRGARLMLQGSMATELSTHELERRLIALGASLGVDMQVVEDALCNWQKHPSMYVLFRG